MHAAIDASAAHVPTRAANAGRARILIPLACAVLAGVVALQWALRHPSPAAPPALTPLGQALSPEEPASPALRYDLGADAPSDAPRERAPLENRPHTDANARFRGHGVLEGRLNLPQGVAAPRAWSLVLAPSQVLVGGDSASARRVEFREGELEFALREVPLGGYEIWAEAEGMSGRHEHLLLARPDALLVYQDLRLVPLAFVEGRVVDAQGVGVAGVPVFLMARDGGARLETRADGSGSYRFERVPDGEHLLEVGFADASLAAPRELAVVAPSLRVPPLEVPVLHELAVLVRDPEGLALAGARVRGWSSGGGRIDAESDASGLARQPWIAGGRVTLEASLPGRPEAGSAREHRDFPAPDGAPLEIRLRR